jgi:hypothetical protein
MKTATQQETKQQEFVRVLGKMPRRGTATHTAIDELGLFTETFGSPEVAKRKNHTVLFWNFVRDNGSDGFSLVSRVAGIPKNPNACIGRREVEVRLVAKIGVRAFWLWTTDRLGAIESGEETPLFLCGGKFVVAPLN